MKSKFRDLILPCVVATFSLECCLAQQSTERSFPVPVATVQSAIKTLPGGTSGPLPILDGFVLSAGRPLQAYQRPYYECAVRVTRADVGSLVRVTARITAWNSSASRYEVLQSNGRIESDLLDRLEQSLGGKVAAKPLPVQAAPATSQTSSATKSSATPEISAPTPHFPSVSRLTPTPSDASPVDPALDQEAKGLEDLLRNQAHPTNLIAVKQDRTPILQDASSDAKVLFLASAEDEFEILDINPEWVHVRISGLSRGWLRRSSVELLDGSQVPAKSSSARSGAEAANTAQPPNRLFSVTGEEDGNFPGDWAPLKGKNVKIISIQQEPGTGRITSPQDKMGFAENLFRSQGAKTSAGLVLIFDAEDGGMVAATSAVIDLWRTGALSEQAFWKQCYLDPPEILGSNN